MSLEGLRKEIYEDAVYEKYYVPNHGDFVIDAGAHQGLFSEKMAGLGVNVLAFEPEPSNFEMLNHKDKSQKICAYQMALWSRPKRLTLNVREDHSGGHSIAWNVQPSHPLEVPATSIDACLRLVQKVHFIKIDVEGSEYEVLLGAIGILNLWRPKIAMEIHGEKYHNDIKRLLSALDYDLTPDCPQGAGWIAYATPL